MASSKAPSSARAFAPGLTVTSSTHVERRRELPLPGELLVRVGDEVKPDQVVARANLPGDLYILKLPEKMGIQPPEVLSGLRVKVGSVVQAGDLLCQHAGLFGWLKTRFNAPVDGTVELISPETGHVALRAAQKPISVNAYIGGRVLSCEEGKSVTIGSQAALVQGIFGVGGERVGSLHVLPVPEGHVLTEADIPSDCEKKVLVGGMSPSAAVLILAAERGASGLVVGSIDDRALHEYVGKDIGIALTGDEDISMTLIVTEGFGRIAMATRIPALLRALQGREVSINGATQVRAGAVRPELIVSNVESGTLSSVATDSAGASRQGGGLEIGSKIRLIRVPYFGLRAEVVELPPKAEEIPTGASARVLRARLEDGEVVSVPRANVELVG